MDVERFKNRFEEVITEVSRVLVGQQEVVEQVLIATLTRGHVLIEGVPGLGKTLLVRALLGLEQAVGISVLDPDWGGPLGWVFNDGPLATPDQVSGLASLPEVYRKADPRYTGRVTVPALWDRCRQTMVNNESAEIMRMLELEFRAFAGAELDLYPEPLRAEIDRTRRRGWAEAVGERARSPQPPARQRFSPYPPSVGPARRAIPIRTRRERATGAL